MKKNLLPLVLLLLLISCRKEAIVWKSDYSLPLLNDTLSLLDVSSDSLFQVGSQGNYELKVKRDLFNLQLQNFISLSDTTITSNFSLSFNTNIPPGYQFINKIEENSLDLEPILLKKVHVEKGKLRLKVENPYNTLIYFQITLPDVKVDNQTLSKTVAAKPGSLSNPSITEVVLTLDGAEMLLTGNSGSESNIIRSLVTIQTDPNGQTTFSSPQHITKVTSSFESIQLNYARGYFGSNIQSDTLRTKLDIFEKWDFTKIDLPSTSLDLNLRNSAKVTGKINLHSISGKNKSGQVVYLSHPQLNVKRNVNSATGSYGNYSPSLTNYHFDFTNSNLEEFLELGIQDLEVAYSYEINPNGNISGSHDEAFSNEILGIEMDLSMPLSLGIEDLNWKDTMDLNLSDLEKGLQSLEALHLHIKGVNRFKVSSEIDFIFLDENKNVLNIKFENIKIPSALNGVSSLTDGQSSSFEQRSFFDSSSISLLSRIRYLVLKTSLNTPNENQTASVPVIFSPDQNLTIQVKLEGKYVHTAK